MKNVIAWEITTQEYGTGQIYTLPGDGKMAGTFMDNLATTHTPRKQYNGEYHDIWFEVRPIYSTKDDEIDLDELEDLLNDPVIEDLPIEDVEEAVSEAVAEEVEE